MLFGDMEEMDIREVFEKKKKKVLILKLSVQFVPWTCKCEVQWYPHQHYSTLFFFHLEN